LVWTTDANASLTRLANRAAVAGASTCVPGVVSQYLRVDAVLSQMDSPVLFPSRQGDPISRHTLDWLIKRYMAKGLDFPGTSGIFTCSSFLG